MLNAVVLAGSSDNEKLPNKPLLKIKDKPMVLYVTDALKATKRIDNILIVGDEIKLREYYKEDKNVSIINESESFFHNLIMGVNAYKEEKRILVVTSDIPMITSEAINDFIDKASSIGGDFCYPIVDKEANNRKYPEAKRTYARLKEGSFTGGNIIYINPKIIDGFMDKAQEVIGNRKKVLKLAKMLGWKFTIRFLLGNLTIPKIEKRVSEMLGIDARAVISEYPEIGNDVDKPSDVEMVQNYIA